MNERTSRWLLDPSVIFLNHGSFGACPVEVIARQQELQRSMEREPMQFLVRDLERRLDDARSVLAAFVGADSHDIVFVTNATSGVNAVLRSLPFTEDDELVTTNHEYNASRNALEFAAQERGARVVIAEIPFPLDSPEEVVSAVLEKVTVRTRLLLIDHVTSPTALVLPVARIIEEMNRRGIETLIDGAHAPGMIPLDLSSLGATYYTGNCHKWICAPKGAGFLWVRRDRQRDIRPVAISHGANSARQDRSRYQIEFDWTGTSDPSACLSVPAAIAAMETMLDGGWDAVRSDNREMALEARRILCDALEIDAPAPEEMIGSMAAVPLPAAAGMRALLPFGRDSLQEEIFREFSIEVPVFLWPAPPGRVLRVSSQLYNDRSDYQALAAALRPLLSREER